MQYISINETGGNGDDKGYYGGGKRVRWRIAGTGAVRHGSDCRL
jgi:hypothetical protein